jgi:uncharacterized protein (TIGR02452 family)
MRDGVRRSYSVDNAHLLKCGDVKTTAMHENEIPVVDNDCLNEALRMKARGLDPVVLNMSSWSHPGGGYLSGAGAQEESLFRRTNYFQHLANPDRIPQDKPVVYPIPEFGNIHSPDVLVFRNDEKSRYSLMEEPVFCSFIAAPAYNRPTTIGNRLNDDYARRTKMKIQGILNTGLLHKHDAIVLSAFGCGAFRNPPGHMAELFKEVIMPGYSGIYKQITFAIVNDHNSGMAHNPRGNFTPFLETFHRDK